MASIISHSMSRYRTLLSLGAVVLVVGLASLIATGAIRRAPPSPRATPTVAPRPVPPFVTPSPVASGKPMKDSNGLSVTVTATITKAVDPSGLTSGFTVTPGQKCIGVTVAVVNGSSAEWLSPLGEIAIVDATGQRYNTGHSIGICLPSSTIDSLVAGGHASGNLYFEVPSAGALDVNWTPSDLSGQAFQTPLG
jgi:hypothetical protein